MRQTYRAVQYFARFYAWYLLRKGNKEEAARWVTLKSHLGLARKCAYPVVAFELNFDFLFRPVMRLGKPMECLQAALKASFSLGPTAEIITMVVRQIGYFTYLTYDAFIWVCSSQLTRVYTVNLYQM